MELDLRTDALTGAAAVVTPARQDRPNLPDMGCPFCPGGLEAPDPYDVRWFPNRWPAMPGARCEVVLYTPRHDATFASLGPAAARRVVDVWAERTGKLGARDDVDYVLVFENRGPEVGATISHPHGQIYAFPVVPPVPRRELEHGGCALCGVDTGERAVATAGGWHAWVPHAATWPFELTIAPTGHVADLPSSRDADRDDLAALLVDALGRLDRLVAGQMPYMLWLHQRPFDGGTWDAAHVHAHIAPYLRAPGTPRFVAAGELGGGWYFNPVVPEDAAAQLRAVAT